MGRTKKIILYLFLVLMFFVFMSACGGTDVTAEPPSNDVCASIVDTKCVRCHYKTRICDALGTKSKRKWKKTINFMMKQGAGLTEEEQKKVIACLSSLPKGSEVVCK